MATNSSSTAPPAWLGGEERKAERHGIRLDAVAGATPGEAISVAIADLTTLGCRVIGATGFNMGRFVTIELATIGAVAGWVAWSRGGECGVDFREPLPVADVARLTVAESSGGRDPA